MYCSNRFEFLFQVRNERNKAREEAKMLRSKLDAALKDTNQYKREKQELETQNEQLRKELEKIHLLLLKHAGQWDHQLLEALENADPDRDIPLLVGGVPDSTEEDKTSIEKDSGIEEYVLQGAVPRHAVELYDGKETMLDRDSETVTHCEDNNSIEDSSKSLNNVSSDGILRSSEEEMLRQKLSMFQLKLDETTKTLQAERE